MEISVVIPCWIVDRTLLEFTHRCVQSIRDTSNVELILIDNGSRLWSDYLTDEADILIKNKHNTGYAKAINSGFKLAKGKYLVAGNDDYEMSEGWTEKMKETFGIADCGISCPHTEGSDKPETYWREIGTPGGWWMIQRETVAEIGFLDEQFFNVFADYDYLFRLWKLNKYVYSNPNITVKHYGEASLSKFKDRTEEYNNGMWLLLDKWQDDNSLHKMLGSEFGVTETKEWLKKNARYRTCFKRPS